jgi:hypothetical protein
LRYGQIFELSKKLPHSGPDAVLKALNDWLALMKRSGSDWLYQSEIKEYIYLLRHHHLCVFEP